jgi:di- and tripeptidase
MSLRPAPVGDFTYPLQVWDTVDLVPLYVLDPYLQTDAGDIYSLAWSSSRETVYFGCQNTSIQWIQFGKDSVMAPPSSQPRPVHKFFAGGHTQYQHKMSVDSASEIAPKQSSGATSSQKECTVLSIPPTNIVSSAHHGYVYCMAVSPSLHQGSDDILYTDAHSHIYLVTGSGDESVKVSHWPPAPYETNGGIVVELFFPLTNPAIYLRV